MCTVNIFIFRNIIKNPRFLPPEEGEVKTGPSAVISCCAVRSVCKSLQKWTRIKMLQKWKWNVDSRRTAALLLATDSTQGHRRVPPPPTATPPPKIFKLTEWLRKISGASDAMAGGCAAAPEPAAARRADSRGLVSKQGRHSGQALQCRHPAHTFFIFTTDQMGRCFFLKCTVAFCGQH